MNHRRGRVPSGGRQDDLALLADRGGERGRKPGSTGRQVSQADGISALAGGASPHSLPSSVGCGGHIYPGFLVSMGSCPDRWVHTLLLQKLGNSCDPVLDLG